MLNCPGGMALTSKLMLHIDFYRALYCAICSKRCAQSSPAIFPGFGPVWCQVLLPSEQRSSDEAVFTERPVVEHTSRWEAIHLGRTT